MTCYTPIRLYESKRGVNPETGKIPLVSIKKGNPFRGMNVPCGRCIGCRLERSRQWAIRCVHESEMHDQNCFITFTYKDEHLIYGGAEHAILYPRHLELFWKRLRKFLGPGRRIKYFACGEYGDTTSRPHYHACLFGYDFEDKTLYSTKNGVPLYSSDTLDYLWGLGDCRIGAVNFETAAYVARYIMKKRLGKSAVEYEEQGIEPEFVRMSRRPGIGSTWLDKYETDVFPHDYTIIRNGVKSKPPKFYSQKYFKSHPLDEEDIKALRLTEAETRWKDNEPNRLRVRHAVKKAQASQLIRNLH